jgi:hypothetical protein
VRRRTPRLAVEDSDTAKPWNTPILLDFSEPDVPSQGETVEAGQPAAVETGRAAKLLKIGEDQSQAMCESPSPKKSNMESPVCEDAGTEEFIGDTKELKIVENAEAQWVLSPKNAAVASSDGTVRSPMPPVARPGGAWKPLKKKDSTTTEPSSVRSFFCKAKPEAVIRLVQQVVSEQERAVPAKRSWNPAVSPVEPCTVEPLTVEPSGTVGDSAKEVGPEVVVVAPPAKVDKPSWARLLDDQAVQEERRKSDIVAKGLIDPALVPKALRRVAENKFSATVKSTDVADSDIDPALQAALKQSTASKEVEEDKLVDMPFNVDVIAKLIEQDLAGPPVHKPLAFKISNKTTFGNIKTTYCNSRKISARGLLLTHKDVPLFDSVTVSASGLVPEVSDMLELVLYDKVLFEKMKVEQQRVKAATMKILKEQVPEAALDVSAYMQDNDLDDSAQAIRGGLYTIKVIAGRNDFEALRIAPSATLSDLLDMYLGKHPETPKDKVRFIFDGDVLQLTRTIEDAELEDGDQLELRT